MSYNDKHNEADGGQNQDGEGHNRSWNCGIEGPTDDGDIIALRERQTRNFLTTLLLLSEACRCLPTVTSWAAHSAETTTSTADNELAYIDWDTERNVEAFIEFTGRLVALRLEHPIFRRQRFLARSPDQGLEHRGHRLAETRPAADEHRGLEQPTRAMLTIFLNGQGIPDRNELGVRVVDDSFLLLINAHHDVIAFAVPAADYGTQWHTVLDTADPRARTFRATRPRRR